MTEDLSLGELQALVGKAARGAGRSHGLAEEAARAAGWLVERGFDGAGAVADLLRRTDRMDHTALCPDQPGLTRDDGPVCGLILGTYLSDIGDVPNGRIGPVLSPILLLPYLADVARATGRWIALEVGGDRVLVGPDGAVSGSMDPVSSAEIRVEKVPSAPAVPGTRLPRARCTPAVFAALADLAQRTYAPATEASRTRGAGAGLIDSD